jgi:hypothetical protein
MNYLNKKLINFWYNQSKKIEWVKFPNQVLKKSKNKFIWFPDGKLNVYDNCITKNLELNKSAIITIDKKKNLNHYSYSDVDSLVDKLINFLKEKKKLTKS